VAPCAQSSSPPYAHLGPLSQQLAAERDDICLYLYLSISLPLAPSLSLYIDVYVYTHIGLTLHIIFAPWSFRPAVRG